MNISFLQSQNDDEDDDEVLFAPEEKFANPRDHMGRTAMDVKSLCDSNADCKCPVCDHKLIVKAGDKLSTHFAHAKGRIDTLCKGGFETPWHKCAKRAAGLREGWLDEFTDKTDRHSRFDAYNPFEKKAFEAVHSLSATYVEKQRSLAGIGIDCKWLFDSAGDFANSNFLPLNIEKAVQGELECSDLLKGKAVDIIDQIGPSRCFLHYLGLAWKMIDRDCWAVCEQGSDMQELCNGEYGVNRLLIDMRARGDIPQERLSFRNSRLVSASWQQITAENLLLQVASQKEQLLEDWRRNEKRRRESRRRKGMRQHRPSTSFDVVARAIPVCKLLSDQMALTEKLDSISLERPPVADGQQVANAIPVVTNHAGEGGESRLAAVHRTWREYCEANGKLRTQVLHNGR